MRASARLVVAAWAVLLAAFASADEPCIQSSPLRRPDQPFPLFFLRRSADHGREPTQLA